MERIKIVAYPRERASKGKKKELRANGMLPGILYGRGDNSISITLDSKALKKAITTGGMNVLLDMEIKQEDGVTVETVMVKELQRHPLQQDFLIHTDLMRISLDEKIEVKVPLNFVGEPAGVIDGGLFQIQYREVSVQCLPAQIPDSIDVPVENLQVNDSFKFAHLTLPPGVEMMEEDPDETIASVLVPQAEEVLEEEEGLEDEAVDEEEADTAEGEEEAGEE